MGAATQVVAALLGAAALAAPWAGHVDDSGAHRPVPPSAAAGGVPQGGERVTTPPGDAGGPAQVGERMVAVAPVGGAVVRGFEQPDRPYGRGHRGIDLAVRPDEAVRAAMAGTVRFAGRVAGETWITVAHRDGLETTYGGIEPAVAAGQRVTTGQRLGTMRAGRRTLDWGARHGREYLDPLGLLTGWRVRLVAPASGA